MSDEIAVVEIATIGDYLNNLEHFEQRHIVQWCYRGHFDTSFKLVPSLFRLDLNESFALWVELEEYVMNSFKREAISFLQHTPIDELEWLAVAQHYGLATRLLTTNHTNEFRKNRIKCILLLV